VGHASEMWLRWKKMGGMGNYGNSAPQGHGRAAL